jgi:hypothetical protein
MIIIADQLEQLIEIIRRDYGPVYQMQRRVPREEEFIAAILREEYVVTGIQQPTYEVVAQEYVPTEWQARPSEARLDSARGRGSRVPPYQQQVLADLDTLRRSPLAALVYIIARAAGQDNATAMNYARLGQAIAALVMVARPVQFSRSISPTTGLPRNAGLPRVSPVMPQSRGAAWARQQLYQRDLQQRGYIERPAGTVSSSPPPSPRLRL